MDVDCDGIDRRAGPCADDTTGQDETSFRKTARKYNIPDLNSSVHSYVVFGNQDAKPTFDPRKAGMEPLSVMAVVCNDQLVSLRRAGLNCGAELADEVIDAVLRRLG